MRISIHAYLGSELCVGGNSWDYQNNIYFPKLILATETYNTQFCSGNI